jgi:glutathione synthase/RimK-type ligase-like ATP-grasp enzyme
MLFFPYNHWNADIERYDKDDRVYGDISFGRDYSLYMKKIARIIGSHYKDKVLSFINPPKACILDRDKLKTFQFLKAHGIKSPEIFSVKNTKGFERLLETHGCLYIKPRFGAMGKGITYADSTGIYTNFRFKKNKILNRLYDYNWRPVRISGTARNIFIETLIEKGFIFQRAVKPLMHKNRVFDLRVYAAFRDIPYMYAKSVLPGAFITNWSQGGRIEGKAFLSQALSRDEIKRIKSLALKAARSIDLCFAGVDIIMDRHTRELNVLEIQSFPGYEKGFDLMRYLARHI